MTTFILSLSTDKYEFSLASMSCVQSPTNRKVKRSFQTVRLYSPNAGESELQLEKKQSLQQSDGRKPKKFATRVILNSQYLKLHECLQEAEKGFVSKSNECVEFMRNTDEKTIRSRKKTKTFQTVRLYSPNAGESELQLAKKQSFQQSLMDENRRSSRLD